MALPFRPGFYPCFARHFPDGDGGCPGDPFAAGRAGDALCADEHQAREGNSAARDAAHGQDRDRPVSCRYGRRRRNKKENKYISENGYPLSLQVLVEGVEKPGGDQAAGDKARRREEEKALFALAAPKSLRSRGTPLEAQWTFVGYLREASRLPSSSYGTTLAEAQKSTRTTFTICTP